MAIEEAGSAALHRGRRELVSKTSGRAVKALTDTQLASLVPKLVRTRRDKARTVAERQRRELRGQGCAARRDTAEGR